jgi:hypothetical protein
MAAKKTELLGLIILRRLGVIMAVGRVMPVA